jgi:hypothetical protein
MKQVSREECEALKRLSGDSVGRVLFEWVRQSRKEYLQKAYIEGARSEDKLACIEKAAVLTELLEAVDEAPAMMSNWSVENSSLDL